MTYDFEAQRQLDTGHLVTPQAGDMWEDHMVFCCIVLDFDPAADAVTLCRAKRQVDRGHWTWDLTKAEAMGRQAFAEWLSYSCSPGTWAHVHRGEAGRQFAADWKREGGHHVLG